MDLVHIWRWFLVKLWWQWHDFFCLVSAAEAADAAFTTYTRRRGDDGDDDGRVFVQHNIKRRFHAYSLYRLDYYPLHVWRETRARIRYTIRRFAFSVELVWPHIQGNCGVLTPHKLIYIYVFRYAALLSKAALWVTPCFWSLHKIVGLSVYSSVRVVLSVHNTIVQFRPDENVPQRHLYRPITFLTLKGRSSRSEIQKCQNRFFPQLPACGLIYFNDRPQCSNHSCKNVDVRIKKNIKTCFISDI